MSTAPAPCSTMRGRNAPVSSCSASTLSLTTSPSASRSLSRKLPRLPKPALLQRPTTSRSPSCSFLVRRPRCCGLPRSQVSTSTCDVVGLAQLVGELLEPLAAAGHDGQVVAALGELARHVGADAGGRAGDDDGGSVGRSWEGHASIHTPVELWTHDRWRFPLPARHRFPIDKYPLLRARVVADGHRAGGRDPRDRPGAVAGARARPRRRAAAAHPRRRAERARGARARAAVVARAGRARAARGGRHAGGGAARAGARRRHEPRRRHPPRRPRLRARLLPVQRRRRRARRAARRGRGRAGAGGRLRRPPGRRHRRPARPGPARLHGLAARRAQLPVPAHPVRPRRRPPDRHRRRRLPRGARRRARRRPAPLRARHRVLPRRRRPVGGRPPRPPGAHQGGPARARRARARPPAARPASRSAWCSPAATRRTSATPSTSTRRPPRRSRQG